MQYDLSDGILFLPPPPDIFPDYYSSIESNESLEPLGSHSDAPLSGHTPVGASPLSGQTPGHTPSRRHPTYHDYQSYRDWPYPPNRQTAAHNFPCTPEYNSPSSGIGSQIESLLESQKEMMKVQQDLVNMVKDVSDRVGDLEQKVSNVTSGEEKMKLPPALSVSLL